MISSPLTWHAWAKTGARSGKTWTAPCAAAAADRPPLSLPLVVGMAIALLKFDRKHLDSKAIFDQAAEGDVLAAERRLSLFCLEPVWRQATLATAAWQAIPAAPESAAGRAPRRRNSWRSATA